MINLTHNLYKLFFKIFIKVKCRLFRDRVRRINKGGKRGKVLIAYLNPFFYDSAVTATHSNISDYKAIVNYFVNNDFEVDLVGCNSSTGKVKKNYSLIFGFGLSYQRACQYNHSSLKLLYCTESSPMFSYQQETIRNKKYEYKYNKKIQLSRSGVYLNDSMVYESSALMVIGNKQVVDTYDSYNKTIYSGIYPSSLLNSSYKLNRKSQSATKNFLWFGSSGAIHKGLHLTIEAVNQSVDFHLFIAGVNEKEKYLLPMSNKVTYVGRLDVQSIEFCLLMDNVSSFVLPSCSEAGSTASSTCMNHGLIPIVSKQTGIDIPEGYQYLQNDSVTEIYERMEEVSKMSYDELLERQYKISNFSISMFSINEFDLNFSRLMDKVIEDFSQC